MELATFTPQLFQQVRAALAGVAFRGTFSAVFLVMWEVPDPAGGDEIEAGIFCLLFCAFLLATSPIWVAMLFFSRNYKDPN